MGRACAYSAQEKMFAGATVYVSMCTSRILKVGKKERCQVLLLNMSTIGECHEMPNENCPFVDQTQAFSHS